MSRRDGPFTMSSVDAAAALGVTPETLTLWIRQGRLVGEKDSRGWWWLDPKDIAAAPRGPRIHVSSCAVEDSFSRLADHCRHRAEHPGAIGALLSFASLSPRERSIVAELMATVAIELDHACEEHRQSRLMVQEALAERAERTDPRAAVA